MPTFKVLKRVEAYVDYHIDVEAEDAKSAAEYATAEDDELDWQPSATTEFEESRIVALDAEGNEIDDTAFGDF